MYLCMYVCMYVCMRVAELFSVFRKKETLFALNSAKDFIRQSDQAIIVEGYMDVVSMFELGQVNSGPEGGLGSSGSGRWMGMGWGWSG